MHIPALHNWKQHPDCKVVNELKQRWFAGLMHGNEMPPFEELMLGNLGKFGDDIMLLSIEDGDWRIIRAGSALPVWLGRDEKDAPVTSLSPDCSVAIMSVSDTAFRSRRPSQSQAHFARDGLVQCYDLLAMPLANRWGLPFVAIYFGQTGPRYSLVDAIFRSAEEGVIALAVIRDTSGKAVDFQVVDLNAGAARLLQRPIDDLKWRRLSEGTNAFQTPEVQLHLHSVIETGDRENFELTVPRGTSVLCLNVSLTVMGDLICAAICDITSLKQREESSRLLFENNPMPMWIAEIPSRRFLRVNDAAVKHYGYSHEAFGSMQSDDLWPADEAVEHSNAIDGLADIFQSKRSWRHLKADGSEIEVLVFGRRIRFESVDAFLVAIVDITERRKIEAKVTYLAHHDALTDLPNRTFYHEKLVEALMQRQGGHLAVLCLDLDLFKNVNDSFGHPVGDQLLCRVAQRLRHTLKIGDTIARIGGDEFAVILPCIADPDEAGTIAKRLIDIIKQPYDIAGLEVVINASIGIAFAPGDANSADDLLKNADMALYRAKAAGRGIYNYFETGMDTEARQRRKIEADLRKAVQNQSFELHYQPLVEIASGNITSFEALLRWHNEDQWVSPVDFIPIAESTGLIGPLGDWVLRTACREASSWPAGIMVAVNLSPVQFRDKNLVPMIVNILASSGLPPARLQLEITESVLLAETCDNLQTLHQLKALGIQISMDDFGTGYSSLSYLRSFPFDKIKIDRSFIKDIDTRPDCLAIVRAISALGSSLGMKTTAEGVETREQLACVTLEGCTDVQGYLFSRPVPAAKLQELIASINGRKQFAA